jgi:integrase
MPTSTTDKPATPAQAGSGAVRKERVKGLANLTDVAIRKTNKPGLYADGGKLYLRVGSATQKSWVLLFQWAGKAREMGLGSLQDVGLAEARKRRLQYVQALERGENPFDLRERERAEQAAKEAAGKALTFKQCAAEVIKVRGPKAPAAQKAWLKYMQVGVGALAEMEPARITTPDVLKALAPYWHSRPAAADTVRCSMETVLDWAHVKGLIPDPWSNPARLKGNLEWLLERRDHAPGHNAALPYKKAGAWMTGLRADTWGSASGRLAVEFCILTATRQGAARGARLSEIDREAKVWTVPKERNKVRKMSTGKEHRVPLSDAAMAVVDKAWVNAELLGSPYLFPTRGGRGAHVSPTTMLNKVKKLSDGFGEVTIHGFRTTFKDWSREVGKVDDIHSEECLAHAVGSKVRRAYARADNLENRRPIMEAWAEFLAVEWVENVVELGSQKAA